MYNVELTTVPEPKFNWTLKTKFGGYGETLIVEDEKSIFESNESEILVKAFEIILNKQHDDIWRNGTITLFRDGYTVFTIKKGS